MALTRANVEFLIVARTGPLLTAAGMAVTVAGANADLNDPIARAVRALGHAVASAVLVANADVAAVTTAETDEFLDLCELFALQNILGNLDDVDIKVGLDSEALNQLATKVERAIERKQKVIARLYGYGLAVPTVGYIRHDFAEHE